MHTPFRRPVLLPIAMVAVTIVLGCESASAVSATTGPTLAAKCQPQLAGSSSFVASGGSGAVDITTQPECEWRATSLAAWITDVTPTSGQGSAQLSFHAAANSSASPRTGEIAVNDGHIQVVQEAAEPAPPPPPPAPSPGGGDDEDGNGGKGKGKDKDKGKGKD